MTRKRERWDASGALYRFRTGAVLAGVFDLRRLEEAQEAGVFLFWQHRLDDLTDFLRQSCSPPRRLPLTGWTSSAQSLTLPNGPAGLRPRKYPALRAAFEQAIADLPTQADSAVWRDGADIVGRAYERLISGAERRPRGQFFTPFWAGELWPVAAGRADQLLLDPGCGSGSLLVPVARHLGRRRARL